MAFGAVLAVVFTACGGDDDDAATSDASAQTEAPADIGDAVMTGVDDEAAAADTIPAPSAGAGSLGSADTASTAGSDLTTLGRDIAIEMQVTMTSNDLRRTVQGIMSAASSHGGAVFASDIDYGTVAEEDESGEEANVTGRATLTVKVPPAELGAVLTGLDQLGTVLSTNQQAQDVTDQLVDLSVRIRNAEQSVDRVRDFLAGTTDLGQMVDLEGELTRRQTDLEQLLATQANITERVALSTLTIDVYPATAAPDPVEDESDGIGDALRSGWDAFLGVLFAVGFVLAILAPFLVLAAVVLMIAWIIARPRRRRPENAGSAATAAATDPVSNPDPFSKVSDDEDLVRANHPQ